MGMAFVLLLVPHFLVSGLTDDPLVADIVAIGALVGMTTTGAIVVSRYSANPVGWLLLSMLIIVGLAESAVFYAQYAIHVSPGSLPGGALMGLAANFVWSLFLATLLYIALIFPGGALLSERWRWASWGVAGTFAALVPAFVLGPEVSLVDPPVPNPITISGAEGILNAAQFTTGAAVAVLAVAALVSLVLRFMRSKGDEREQIKWFAYAIGLFGGYMVLSILLQVTGNGLSPVSDDVLFVSFFSLLPVSLAVSMLKYRLYDIDLIINRTLVYGPLTAIVAATYIASIQIFRLVFEAASGESSDAAIILTTLVAAAAFWIVRMRLTALVDRHFKNPHEPSKEMKAFCDRVLALADMVDPGALNVGRISAQLLRTSVSAYGAQGGAIQLHAGIEGAGTHEEGDWDGNAVVSLTLSDGATEFGLVQLGARKNQRPYAERDIEVLTASVDSIAEVLAVANAPVRKR